MFEYYFQIYTANNFYYMRNMKKLFRTVFFIRITVLLKIKKTNLIDEIKFLKKKRCFNFSLIKSHSHHN